MTNKDVKTGRQDLLKEWDGCTLDMMFQIDVTEVKTGEEETLLIYVYIDRDTSEINCDFNLNFPFETEIDETLDYNLEGLLESITQDRNFTEEYYQR